jgi:hypothetical protein
MRCLLSSYAQFMSIYCHVHLLNDAVLIGKLVRHQLKNDKDEYKQLVKKIHEVSGRAYSKYCAIV